MGLLWLCVKENKIEHLLQTDSDRISQESSGSGNVLSRSQAPSGGGGGGGGGIDLMSELQKKLQRKRTVSS